MTGPHWPKGGEVASPVADTPSRSSLLRPEYRFLASRGITLTAAALPANLIETRTDVGPMLTEEGDATIGAELRNRGNWEPIEGHFFRRFVLPGMSVLDIGANIGYFTLLFSTLTAPGGRVLAVEAEPANFALLRENMRRAGVDHVELLPLAAGSRAGMTRMLRDPANPGGSRANAHFTAGEQIPVVRLDDVLDPAARIDLIKIDVEGMDHEVVRGLQDTIARWRPALLVEFNPRNIERRGDDPATVLSMYRSLGARVWMLGAELLWLRGVAGSLVDTLIQDDLTINPDNDRALTALAHRVGCVNLVLSPDHNRQPLSIHP